MKTSRLIFRAVLAFSFGVLCLRAQQQVAPQGQECLIQFSGDRTLYIGAKDSLGFALPLSGGMSGRFRIGPGLANSKYVSLESVEFPGYFLRHQNHQIKLHPYPEHDGLFAADATFILVPSAQNPSDVAFQSYNYRECYIMVTRDNALYISPNPEMAKCTFTILK